MEYFLGAVTMLIAMTVFNRILMPKLNKPKYYTKFSQSRAHALVSDLLAKSVMDMFNPKPRIPTQSLKHNRESTTRIMMIDGLAYWIDNNALTVANLVDGNVDTDSAKKVDTMGLDDVQLKKVIFIVEKLTEGFENDSGNTRNS